MTHPDWAQLKKWFEACTDGNPDDARRALTEAEATSPELAVQLRDLLREHGSQRLNTRSLVDRIAIPSEREARDYIGAYRLLRELGRGGTGIVFLAERSDDEFHRKVALKLLRYAVWDRDSSAALTRERRALSQLRHRNIASLVDWGTTEDGIPWLAVEYVDGRPIDEFARGIDGLQQALDLFEQVCDGVQYAHQNLVVHGDLKPQNIFVAGDGTVKLLDFGISSLLGSDTQTLTAERRLTPAYASPEQLEGKVIGVATDVYSLGLILYELLTGTSLSVGSMETVWRRISHGAQPPSGQAELPAPRRRALRGDLDQIVLHALEKDPAARYSTVGQFHADVKAHRGGYPIRARKTPAAQRVSKFIGRNRVALAAAALAAFGLVGGTVLAVWKAREAQAARQSAERRNKELQKLAHSVIFDLHDTINRIPGSVAARRKLIATGLQYMDSLRSENVRDDALEMELAHGYYRMAYSQGGTVGLNIGDASGARRNYKIALGILDGLWKRHHGDRDIGTLRDAVAFNYALSFNNPDDGIALALPYTADADATAAADPAMGPLLSSGLMHQTLGRIYRNKGDLGQALAELDLALAIFQRLDLITVNKSILLMVQSTVGRDQSQHMLATTGTARAAVLLDMGHCIESLAAVELAFTHERAAMSFDSKSPPGMRALVVLHGAKSRALLLLGRRADSLAAARDEMTAVDAFLQADGSSLIGRRDQTQAKRHLANALVSTTPGAAAPLLQSALASLAAIADADPEFLFNRVQQAGTLNDYGFALLAGGHPETAREQFRLAQRTAENVLQKAPSWADALREKAMAQSGLLRTGLAEAAPSCLADWQALRARSPLRHTAEDQAGTCIAR